MAMNNRNHDDACPGDDDDADERGNSCDDDDDDDGGGDTLDAGVLPASKQEYSESRNSLPIEQPKPSKA